MERARAHSILRCNRSGSFLQAPREFYFHVALAPAVQIAAAAAAAALHAAPINPRSAVVRVDDG